MRKFLLLISFTLCNLSHSPSTSVATRYNDSVRGNAQIGDSQVLDSKPASNNVRQFPEEIPLSTSTSQTLSSLYETLSNADEFLSVYERPKCTTNDSTLPYYSYSDLNNAEYQLHSTCHELCLLEMDVIQLKIDCYKTEISILKIMEDNFNDSEKAETELSEPNKLKDSIKQQILGKQRQIETLNKTIESQCSNYMKISNLFGIFDDRSDEESHNRAEIIREWKKSLRNQIMSMFCFNRSQEFASLSDIEEQANIAQMEQLNNAEEIKKLTNQRSALQKDDVEYKQKYAELKNQIRSVKLKRISNCQKFYHLNALKMEEEMKVQRMRAEQCRMLKLLYETD